MVELGREFETWFDCIHASGPYPSPLWLDISVERRVDLNHVKTLRQICQRMLTPALHAQGIENSLPVVVRPTGGAYKNFCGRIHAMFQTSLEEKHPEKVVVAIKAECFSKKLIPPNKSRWDSSCFGRSTSPRCTPSAYCRQ